MAKKVEFVLDRIGATSAPEELVAATRKVFAVDVLLLDLDRR
jgi:hypothetical protein